MRTVQRYERDLGLLVRRPRGKSRSAVIALPAELDQWLATAPRLKPVAQNNQGEGFVDYVGIRKRNFELRAALQSSLIALLTNLTVTKQHIAEMRQCGRRGLPTSVFNAAFSDCEEGSESSHA